MAQLAMSNKELAERLKKDHNYQCGPIVASTRSVYEKKLLHFIAKEANSNKSSQSPTHSHRTQTRHRASLQQDVRPETPSKEKPSRSTRSTINNPVHSFSETSDTNFDRSFDTDWTSYSIVGVFLLFFLIIAALYLYSRMEFNINSVNPISLSVGMLWAFLWKTFKFTIGIILIIGIVVIIIKYISHKKQMQTEEQVAIQDLVRKSIELLQSPDEPHSMPVINIRDTLLTPQQRKDARWKKIWSNVVEYIETHEYHINSALEEINGEEFKTWKWCGHSSAKDRYNEFRMNATTMKTGTIEWQGSAFGSDSTSGAAGDSAVNKASLTNGSRNSYRKALTEFLKVRNIPCKSDSPNWNIQIRNAIIEKCTAYSPNKYHGILHIDMSCSDDKEFFIYIKCDSLESATNAFAALHGWWCERLLISVKFLKSDRYYERFPEAAFAKTPLQILNIDSTDKNLKKS